MGNLEDVMAYLCSRYPFKEELSKARLTKMVYLADWRMALTKQSQITNLDWTFNHYGPYVDDVKDAAEANEGRFTILKTTNMYGSPKEVIGLKRKEETFASLSEPEIAALDHVVAMTKDLTWAPFIKLVYSTYPIATQARHVHLDLAQLATKYQRELAAVQVT
ncbi:MULTISPECIES: Panacea domain-containing protein [Cryobacterium]|uniref:DUF4065 domain-containing protein n=1 Tax=Cryobacterium breve TaxID=1259258 RepID=A0ABY2JBE1_9MICO|nr:MULTISPECIES: Panacea domain-containing protein [Cryobacterium]TFC91334.1 DUF4065 domain-containing protein [Cryobacterium sp. TmT3-12]TFD01359.1 DUF4065 domain-containing protein [Cryobacterium breve]